MKIGFIGAGNMAKALIHGWINAGNSPELLAASDASGAAGPEMSELGVAFFNDNQALVDAVDFVVIAVKPQNAREVVQSLNLEGKVLVSLCAGLPVRFFTDLLGHIAVVRTMPNTPALVGAGATGLFANGQVSSAQRADVQALFEAGGLAVWVEDEALIDAVTATSGSGPAYFFGLIEHMIASAIELGLEPAVAKALVCQTALGAAKMAQQSEVEPGELRQRVTSKGGTTAAALEVFDEANFGSTVNRAMQAAAMRAKALADQA